MSLIKDIITEIQSKAVSTNSGEELLKSEFVRRIESLKVKITMNQNHIKETLYTFLEGSHSNRAVVINTNSVNASLVVRDVVDLKHVLFYNNRQLSEILELYKEFFGEEYSEPKP